MKKKYTPKLSAIPYQFVAVYWVDIESDSSWRQISDLLTDSLPVCVSTGWLIKRDDNVYRLASDFNFNPDGTISEVGNTTIIPSSVVKKCIKIPYE
tara:strand:- start:3836 stop:4123 length:288 start_codon:yes stop_codon:yes gene_type:complete